MTAVEVVAKAAFIASFINAVCLLSMQLWAYGRFKHVSFFVLFISSMAALTSLSLMTLANTGFFPSEMAAPAYLAGSCLYFVYMGLGLWGVFSLFRAYGALAPATGEPRR